MTYNSNPSQPRKKREGKEMENTKCGQPHERAALGTKAGETHLAKHISKYMYY